MRGEAVGIGEGEGKGKERIGSAMWKGEGDCGGEVKRD
jgi:hypothetical protein